MIQEFFMHYLNYLENNPGRIDSNVLWTVSTLVVWGLLFAYRKVMIEGMSGANKLLESAEIIGYVFTWMFPPIVFYATYYNQPLQDWIWWFLSFGVAYTLGGRWILEWILAFKTGQSKVESSEKSKSNTNE